MCACARLACTCTFWKFCETKKKVYLAPMNEYEKYFKAREEYEVRLLDRNKRIALRVWSVLIPLFFLVGLLIVFFYS